jgi:WD40 repeat protein
MMRLRSLLPALVLCAALPAAAAEPSRQPLLRVETGAHTGGISSMATDAANRYLVTGGQDKTVRLWSRSSGELLKVIRPPIGDGGRGNVFTVAMSPDGATVAVGGNFCNWFEKTYCAYLFDTASGRMTRRIGGLPEAVTHIAYSPDGSLLALGLREPGGLRLIRAVDGAEAGADADYAGFIDDIHFDGRGRLATASGDANVRVYAYGDGGLRLIVKKHVREFAGSWGRPRAVRFSPDGTRLAVGQSRGASWVSVHDPATLNTLYLASTNWERNTGVASLEWSADGEYLYAGTVGIENKPFFVRRWSSGGRGFATDLPTGNGFVMSVLAMKDGGLAFATEQPAVGLYDGTGKLAWWRTQQAASFYAGTEAFKVSADGLRVEFDYGDKRGVLNFDVAARRLAHGPSKDVAVRAPATAAGRLNFYNQWRDTRRALMVGKRRLALGAFETTRSLSIAPDARTFAVGTSSQLRSFAGDGRQLWAVPSVSDAYAVNHSGDGRLIVAAFGDGTIRWYRRDRGRLLATLYVAPDLKRWVLATPTGFYDASVGAEDFVGWHVNRAANEESDFFPVSRLRARFYRPEVVARILASADDAQALKLAAAALGAPAVVPKPPAPPVVAPPPPPVAATPPPAPVTPPAPPVAVTPPPAPETAPEAAPDREEAVESTVQQAVVDISQVLPPVVTILSPAPGTAVSSSAVTVRYLLRSAGDAPVIGVRARVNGLAQSARNLAVAAQGETREITVNVPPEDAEIMLFAENRHGVSAPASVRVAWQGKPPAPAAEAKPVLYVLAIGVSAYDKPEYRLNYAAKDARDFVATVQKQKGRMYSDVVVRLLADHDASSGSVIAGFTWLQQQVTPKDVGMVFIAGHGLNDERGRYYFLPANVDLDRLEATGVPFNEIRTRLANLNGKGLLFVDTCHAGNVMGGRLGLSNDVNGMLNELSSPEYGLVVLASSTGKQFSLEDSSWGNGAFTKALVEGLNGQADLKKRGRITHKMLDFYVSDRVDELTHGQQTPVNPSPQGVPDYPVALTGT